MQISHSFLSDTETIVLHMMQVARTTDTTAATDEVVLIPGGDVSAHNAIVGHPHRTDLAGIIPIPVFSLSLPSFECHSLYLYHYVM